MSTSFRFKAGSWLVTKFGLGFQKITPMLSSSYQTGFLSPARIASTNPVTGPVAGINLTTGTPWYHSLHGAYAAGLVKAPNAVILGAYNSAKSSLAKCVYGLHVLAAGGRVAVFDRKRQHDGQLDSGEYARLVEVTGGTQIVFDRRAGAGCTINILDPALAASGGEDTTVGQDGLLLMAAELACGAKLIDTSDSAPAYALRMAHRAALARAKSQGRVAVLADVVEALYSPSPDAVPGPKDGESVATVEDLARWGLPVALGLLRFIDGDLSGLVSGQTSDEHGRPLDLSNPLIVFDTSALTEGSEALGFIIAVASAWIAARWSSIPGAKILINEEAYFTDRLTGVPAILRALAKRGRASGLGVVTLIHHLSDFKEGSDLVALVKETDVVHIFRQDKADDVDQVIEFFDLPPALRETIKTLPNGVHVLRQFGSPVQIIQHVRSAMEVWLTNTDQAMLDGISKDEQPELAVK